MPMSCLLCSLGPGPVSVTFIKHIRFYTKAQGSTPSDWSKEMHGESCWGSWQGWHTVNLMVGDFWSEFLKCQPRVRSGRAEGSPEVRNCQVQAGEGGGICLHLSCSSCNPVCLFPVGWRAVWSMDGLQPAPLSALGWTRAGGAEALEASPCPPPKPCSGPWCGSGMSSWHARACAGSCSTGSFPTDSRRCVCALPVSPGSYELCVTCLMNRCWQSIYCCCCCQCVK